VRREFRIEYNGAVCVRSDATSLRDSWSEALEKALLSTSSNA
jgi:hypothetical protein